MIRVNTNSFALVIPLLFISIDALGRGRGGANYGYGSGGDGSLIIGLLFAATVVLFLWLCAKGIVWISDTFGEGAAVLAVNMLWIGPIVVIFLGAILTGNMLAAAVAVGGATLGYYQYTKSDGKKDNKMMCAYIGGFVLLSPFIAMLGYVALIMVAMFAMVFFIVEPKEAIREAFEKIKSIHRKFTS